MLDFARARILLEDTRYALIASIDALDGQPGQTPHVAVLRDLLAEVEEIHRRRSAARYGQRPVKPGGTP